MPATPAPNNAGLLYQSKYEIVPGKVYKLGDCDKHVSDMQQRLMLLGYLPSDEPSDVFNKPLEQAVKLFQRANHLAQSGEADETLLRLLYSDAPAEYVIEYGNVGNDVRMLQERLMQLGYYSEKINGYFGTATRTAVGQFRLSNNLPESSVVDTEAFNLIFSAYAVDDGNLPFETGGPYYTVSPAPSLCCHHCRYLLFLRHPHCRPRRHQRRRQNQLKLQLRPPHRPQPRHRRRDPHRRQSRRRHQVRHRRLCQPRQQHPRRHKGLNNS